MSMRIIFLKDHDGHKAHKEYFILRDLACRLCETGIALPTITYNELVQKNLAEKKAKLIKNRDSPEDLETTVSKKMKKKEKMKRL